MLTSSIYSRQPKKWDVNVRRYNRIVIRRKIRIASYVPAPRLIKGFHNNPTLVVK